MSRTVGISPTPREYLSWPLGQSTVESELNMSSLRKYSDLKSRAARAEQAWVILTRLAYDHRTVSYGRLGQLMQTEMKGGALSGPLGDIFYFCQYHHLPPLTAIVVDQKTGEPSTGFPLSGVPALQQRVFNFAWAELAVPTEREFDQTRKWETKD